VSEPVPSPAGFPVLRRLLIAFLATLTLLAAVAWVGPAVMPQRTVQSVAAALLGRALGYPVVIAGEADLSLLPTLLVEAREVSALAGGGKDTPVLFDIPHLVARADALSVLFSRIHVEALHLERPILRLAVDARGGKNWQRAQAPAAARDRGSAFEPDHEWGIWRELRIDSVKITGGRVIFQDRRAGRRIVAEEVSLASSNPVNTDDGPGFLISGGGLVNGERFTLKFETGPVSKFLSGDRLPVVIGLNGAPLEFRFQGGAAKRQFFVAEGTASLHVDDLNRADAWLGGVFAAPVAGPLDVNARIAMNGPRLAFEDIALRAGESRAKGAAVFSGGAGDGLRIEANLETDVLNLAPFVPTAGSPGGLNFPAMLMPRNAKGALRLSWSDLRYADVRLGGGDARVTLGAGRHVLDAKLRLADFFRGEAEGRLRLGLGEGMTSLQMNFTARKVAAQEFLAAAAEGAPFTGLTDVSMELLSVGGSTREVIAALRGRGKFNVRDGEILESNLVRHLSGGEADSLPFRQLVGSFAVRQGILSGEDLLLRSANLSLLGAGEIDLAENRIDMELRSLDPARGSGGGLRPVKPFHLQGTLAAFEILPQ